MIAGSGSLEPVSMMQEGGWKPMSRAQLDRPSPRSAPQSNPSAETEALRWRRSMLCAPSWWPAACGPGRRSDGVAWPDTHRMLGSHAQRLFPAAYRTIAHALHARNSGCCCSPSSAHTAQSVSLKAATGSPRPEARRKPTGSGFAIPIRPGGADCSRLHWGAADRWKLAKRNSRHAPH